MIKENYLCIYFYFSYGNLICENFNHGDLHQGNWKVQSRSQIAIYDFGFCWSLPEDKTHIIQTAIDVHEEGIQGREDFIKVLSNLMYDLIDHREILDKDELKLDLIEYVKKTDLVHLTNVTISPNHEQIVEPILLRLSTTTLFIFKLSAISNIICSNPSHVYKI